MKLPFKFRGDMSASTRTDWVKIPSQTKRLGIGIGWPATGTPVGVLSVEISDNPVAVSGTQLPLTIANQPAGTANGGILDNIVTSGEYIALVYTRTSGGAGAAFTDSSQTAGTSPVLMLKE